MADGKVRVRGRDDEEVTWSRRAARNAGTLSYIMDDAAPADGVYPAPMLTASVLGTLAEMCHPEYVEGDSLMKLTVSELAKIIEGAIFLDAQKALNHAQHALASRLAGKHADELRELLGATDDFASAAEREAALSEPAFTPGWHGRSATSASGPPALQPQPSLSWLPVNDDAQEAALACVEASTLLQLKGVSRSCQSLARRVLCSRLCCCGGVRLTPTQLDGITQLDIEQLHRAGRPWDAAAAGRLPELAQLHGFGFAVDVAAVRTADQTTVRCLHDVVEEGSALRSCVRGEGEPPIELMLSAIACAGTGPVCNIPVEVMRSGSLTALDLSGKQIESYGARLISLLMPVMASLTSLE